MNSYSRYICKILKKHSFALIKIIPLLIDENNSTEWDISKYSASNTKYSYKCIVGGYGGLFSNGRFFSTTAKHFGTSIKFNCQTNLVQNDLLVDINEIDETTDKILQNIFLQMMALTEKQSIYLNGEKIFNKGEQYRYLIEADLA